jgi:division protein CdvB (Snf7/Vps24/ESCRT-III family)
MDAQRRTEDPFAYLDDCYHEHLHRSRRAQSELAAAATDEQRAAARAALEVADRRKREILNALASLEDSLVAQLCESTE